MQCLDRGEAVDREQLLDRHPELADELRSYFAGSDEVMQDVLEDLGLGGWSTWAQPALPEQPVPPALSPDEGVVLGVLQAEPLLLDRIAKLAGMPASAATAVLSRLELSGLATRHPGGRFARSVDAAGPR